MTVAALDIGGTHVSGGRVDVASGRVAGLVRVEYEPHAERGDLLERIVAVARGAGAGAQAIGVAVPGPFDYANGICTIRGVAKLDALYGLDLRHALAEACEIAPRSVVFLNDAEAFLLGEAGYGAARGYDRAIGLTLGTGLGSAFLAGGAIVREGNGVPPGGEVHLLSFRGAPVEDRLSARGLRARTADGRDARELAAAARAGETGARRVWDDFAAELVEFLEPIVSGFEPACIVVGGSIARAWDLLGPGLESALPGVAVVRAAHIDDAALLGAGRFALSSAVSP